MTLCRELTKKHESVFKSTLGEILAYHKENPPKGECVMIIEGKSFKELKEESQEEFLKIPLSEHMKRYMDQGHSKKEAMKLVAKDRGVGKREIYQQLLEEEEEGHINKKGMGKYQFPYLLFVFIEIIQKLCFCNFESCKFS